MKNTIIVFAFVLLILLSGCNDEIIETTSEVDVSNNENLVAEDFNHLIDESSPYLQQHADNPVNWYPYSEEALEKAVAEDKLIFLSIGYSTCHWCHVMARESFEDDEVATVLNDNFISIKVDREERPDLDNFYMNLYQYSGGNGGWPLNVILTPDNKMFYGATYLPKDSENGQIGLIDTLTYLNELWVDDRDKILSSADNLEQITEALNEISEDKTIDSNLDDSVLNGLRNTFDQINGGFSTSPKFPTTHYMDFIMTYGIVDDFEMVYQTLDSIINGGMNDQLEGGFHRYTIDHEWQIPHFEKMLYDQAGLIRSLSYAYELSEKETYKTAIYKTLDFLDSRLLGNDLYYAAMDAESEHEEGKFYIWSLEEIETLLNQDELELVTEFYSLSETGNYLDEVTRAYTGFNILYSNDDISTFALNKGLDVENTVEMLDVIHQKMIPARNKRVLPHIDKKMLSDWNAMLIESLFIASDKLDDKSLLQEAKDKLNALELQLTVTTSEFTLYHSLVDGKLAHEGFLDDYAYLLKTYLTAYEFTYESHYLVKADQLAKVIIEKFWSDEYQGFMYSNTKDSKQVSQKKYFDLAYPSGYSIVVQSLEKLGKITANPDYHIYASQSVESIAEFINSTPFISLNIVSYLTDRTKDSYEIVIVEGQDDATLYLQAIEEAQIKNVTIIFKNDLNAEHLSTYAPYTENYSAIKGNTTVYICQNATCKLPISDINQLYDMLNSLK